MYCVKFSTWLPLKPGCAGIAGDSPTAGPLLAITVSIQLSLLPFKVVENGFGGGTMTWPAGPSPFPLAPWHPAHFCAYTLAAPWAAAALGPAATTSASTQ
jgi:hypothetical protein